MSASTSVSASEAKVTVENKKVNKRVIIGLPGSTFSNNFLVSWTQSLYYLWENGYQVVVSPATSSHVTFARMKTLGLNVLRGEDQKAFNGEVEYDVFVSLDSDMVFTPTMLVELIESTTTRPVVSGYYLMEDGKNLAVVKEWSDEYFAKNGTFKFLTLEDVDAWLKDKANTEDVEVEVEVDVDVPNEDGSTSKQKEKRKETRRKLTNKFMEVSYAGMGFFACRKEVLDSLKYPFFDAPLQRIKGPDGKTLVDVCSEDVAFAKNLRSAGYTVQLHMGLRVGHEKSVVL